MKSAPNCDVTASFSEFSYDISFGLLYDINSAPNKYSCKMLPVGMVMRLSLPAES